MNRKAVGFLAVFPLLLAGARHLSAAAPYVFTPAAATPSMVTGNTTLLTVLGADDSDEATLTYTWSTFGASPTLVAFSPSGTNDAKNAIATFFHAGTYGIQVTIQDGEGLTCTSSVTVTVVQTLTSLFVSPAHASIKVGTTRLFSVSSRDQFNRPMLVQQPASWTVTGGTINSSGLFTAGATPSGPLTVTVTSGGRTATAVIEVITGDPPSITLTSPAPNSVFSSPASITLTADATDTDGTIAKVVFFAGASKLGEVDSAPFTLTWTNVSARAAILSARAVDNTEATNTSPGVEILVNPSPTDLPPSVALVLPAPATTVQTGKGILMQASASDSDGSISRVDFYVGTVFVGQAFTAPFQFTWNGATPGTYKLTARAADNDGVTTPSPAVSITVVKAPPKDPPVSPKPAVVPNPCRQCSQATLVGFRGSVHVYDHLGRRVADLGTNRQWNVSDLASGVYYLQSSDDNVSAMPWVKMR